MAANWPLVGTGAMLIVMTTVAFYLITVYTPTFGKSVLELSTEESLLVTPCVGLSNFIWPVRIRTTGFSLAYSLATALFGGMTPRLSTWLIETTGDKAAPGCWTAGAGAISLLATILVYHGIVKARAPVRA